MRAAHDITPEQAAEEILKRRAAKKSLHEFLNQAWPSIEAGRDFKDNWHLQAKCEHLEAVTRGDIRNLLINEPPRATKSTLVCVAWPAWVWIDKPELQWLFTSYSFSLGIRDSRRTRALINSPWYQTRFGKSFSILDDSNRLDRFDNNVHGYRLTTSVDSHTMGEGGDIIVCDDPNNTRDQSDTMIDTTLSWWQNVMPTRVNDFKTCRRVVIQQRTHERDLSGFILQENEGDWVHLRIPMEYESQNKCYTVKLPSTYGKKWSDPRTKDGELLDPKRIGPEELRRLKKDLGSQYAISGQLQQRPAPAEGGLIKKAWFKIWANNEPPKCDFRIMSVDTALSEKKQAAYSAVTTWGVFQNEHGIPNVILLSMWRDKCEYPDLRDRIQRMANDYLDDGPKPMNSNVTTRKADIVLIEAKANGLSLIQDLLRAGVIATPFYPDKLGDKLQRVRLVTPMIEAGRVWMPGLPPDYKRLRSYADIFVEQAAVFPNSTSRDLVDTATQVLWKLQQGGWIWHPSDDREDKPPRDASHQKEAYY